MTLTHLEDDYDHFYAPRFEVTIGEQTYREADGRISNLSVETGLSKTATASFRLNADYEHERGTFLEDALPDESGALTVEMGYGTRLQTTFEGRVTAVQPNFPAQGGPTLQFQAEGPTATLLDGTNSRSWTETTLSSVITEVLEDAGIDETDVDLGDDDLDMKAIFQDDQSDREFLRTKFVERFGIELFASGGTVTARLPDPGAEPTVTLEYGQSLQSFQPTGSNESTPPGTAKVRGWDPAQKSAITAETSVPTGDDRTNVESATVEDQKEAQLMADANAYELTPADSGTAKTIGLPEIEPGTVVALERLGERFSGRYYVTACTHRFDDSGYTTSFDGDRTDHLEELT